ncbi:MAG: S1 RNA-binding domain-containing protein, partial [Sphingomicrobium sp.]
GSVVEGEVKNSTEFGLFIGLEGDVDGMVHMSDIAWGVSGEEALALHRKGELVKAQVLDVDVEKERISLGMKQLEGGGAGAGAGAGTGAGAGAASSGGASGGSAKKGEILTVLVRAVQDAGLDVQVGDDGVVGFIKRTELGRDRDEQRAERFQVGQKFDALVTGFDRSKKPTFSIKALQISEEKQAVKQYGSSDSGASLGDILGAALKEKAEASAKKGKATAEPKEAKATKEPKEAKAPKAAAKKAKAEAKTEEAETSAEPAEAVAEPAAVAEAAAEPAVKPKAAKKTKTK